ncbi:hypothetical protein D0865_04899 [Hortaea werneckii]|uniref:SET domain-containing protein n=1 Tax=Hortaea werneckii TaxID=91943 RepID=A0A3M7CQ94_HORWE|nr:hypothetical protein D0865_04899 [Hortaea werneckii]
MVETTPITEALEQWLRDNGGYLHPDLRVAVDAGSGTHWRATAALDPGTKVSSVPHSLALSYLNALVDDAYPVFGQNREKFVGVENIGFFYLMTQYINKQTSFWKPYLDSLPSPEDEFTTPMWFDSAQDMLWLEGTDASFTTLGRKEIYEHYHQIGLDILSQAGMDTQPYTWNLFRWAVTIFTSRSFSSRAISPQETKYWTSYKTNAQGQRQTVLLDMSQTPSEDLHFSVLFPIQDVPNTSHESHIDWTFDPGRFNMAVGDFIEAGGEVFNNYGSKGNDELLIGYGFCMPENPHDSIVLTLKPPPEDLQATLRRTHPGYFTIQGEWNSEHVTFRLKQPMDTPSGKQIFIALPEALLDLMICIVRHERGLPFEFFERPLEYVMEDDQGRRCLPFIAKMIVTSLAPKLAKISATQLPSEPQNEKQRFASIYRKGQLRILESTINALRGYTRSLLKQPRVPGARFVTLEGLIELWSAKSGPEKVAPFIAGVEACSGTADVDQLRAAGWEEDVLVMLLAYIWLEETQGSKLESVQEEDENNSSGGQKANWVQEMLPEYVAKTIQTGAGPADSPDVAEDVEHGQSILDLVKQAEAAVSEGAWHDERWDEKLVVAFGKMLQHESMLMMVPNAGANGREEPRPVIYIHSYFQM